MGIKRKNGAFVAQYTKRHPITKQPVSRRRIGIKTLAGAKRVYENLIIEVNDILKRAVVPVWPKLLGEYFRSLQDAGLMNTTIYNKEKTLRHYTEILWKDRVVDEIKTDEIREILNSKLKSNAESYKKYFLKCIRGAFNYAVEKGFVQKNPTPLLKFKPTEKIKSVLTEDQITTLLFKAQEQDWDWYSHYAVALFTGLRNGELYAMTWKNVDIEKRQILVKESWNSKNGFKSTKSGDDRVVEIPNPLIPVLRDLKLKFGESDFVLPRLGKWDKGEQARELRMFLKSLGLPEIRFHDLRASWATLLLSKGVAPSKVMTMGGWRNMQTMMIYMRKAGIDIKDSTNVLDSMVTHGIQTGKVIKFRPS